MGQWVRCTLEKDEILASRNSFVISTLTTTSGWNETQITLRCFGAWEPET